MTWRKKAIRRNFMMTLNPDTLPAFESFMVEHGFDSGQEPQALRTLIQMQLAATPEIGAVSASMARGFLEVKTWALHRLNYALREIEAEAKELYKQLGRGDMPP